jgi:heterogeneous nuclear ribonucleoprotein L
VLHVRNVSPETSHEELVAFVSQFGSVVASEYISLINHLIVINPLPVCFLSKFQQALVEMETPQAASAVVMYSKSTPVYIKGKEVHFEYSKSQSINTNATPKAYHRTFALVLGFFISYLFSMTCCRTSNPASIHHILLCTILNPIYNITVDVIYAIMSPYGNVLRIVVFNKNGVQSLVEFENAYSAVQAYTALDGKDVSHQYLITSM